MINKSNDLPSFVNETNLPNIVNKLTDAKNIKISNNKYGNRVQTVVDKIVEKADDITKAIEQEVVNDSYSFKVGTGNVDVSTDVQDGFGEIGIKGVTYQNILGARINPSDGVEKNNNTITFNKVAQTKCTVGFPDSLAQVDKTYTLIFDILENTIENPTNGNVGKINIVSYNSGNYFIKYKETGHKKILLKQPATSTGKPYVEFYNNTSGKFVMTAPILLEGDHTNNPNLPSYFEGIVGVGDRSKNLLNPSKFIHRANITMNKNQIIDMNLSTSGGQCTIFDGLNLPKGTYKVTAEVLEGSYTGGNLVFYDSNNTKFTEVRLIGTYTIDASNNNINRLLLWDPKGICKIRLQLEKGYVATSYEPYYEGHKIEILSSGHNLLDLLSLNCIIKRHVTKHELTSNSVSFSVGTENSDP